MTRRGNAAKRAARAAAMGAGVTGDYLGYLARTLFMSGSEKEEALKATHRTAASRMTKDMAELRGPLMKLGQTLSLHGDVLPVEMVEELTNLQMRVPGMHPPLVDAQFRASLGRDPEDVFKSFERTPFAAASLGQVHRAVTKQGEHVAVKIQYPGIQDAVHGDLDWFRTAMIPARMTKHLPTTVIDELQEQLIAETDYGREARNIELFHKGLEPLSFVIVPKLYPRLCGEYVLTMSLLDGMHLDAFLATRPSQKLRDLVGGRLFELYYFQVLKLKALHCDPHWGNYLFRTDGSIGLLDFGCVKFMPDFFVENLRKAFLYPGARDSDEFLELMRERYAWRGQKLSKAARAALTRFATDFYGKVYPWEPEKEAVPFDFSDPAFMREWMKNAEGLSRSKASLPEYLMLARGEIGLYQTLHRLGARVHTSRIVRKYL